jgi:hypothetical protein
VLLIALHCCNLVPVAQSVWSLVPPTTGSRQAALTVSDNAPGSPQLAQLTGTGVPPQSAVTLVPGTLSFPDTNQGTTSASQTVTLTSAGVATLHIASVLLTGSNPNDFNLAKSTCTGALAVNANCTIE